MKKKKKREKSCQYYFISKSYICFLWYLSIIVEKCSEFNMIIFIYSWNWVTFTFKYSHVQTCPEFPQSHVSFICMGTCLSGHHMIYIHSCHVWLWRMVVVFMKPADSIELSKYRQNLNLHITCHNSIKTFMLSDVIK